MIETKVSDIGIETKTENSIKSRTGNIGSDVIETEVTLCFRRKFSVEIGDVGFGILGAKVIIERWVDNIIGERGREEATLLEDFYKIG